MQSIPCGASGTFDSLDKNAKPDYNIYTLYGALVGGPNAIDDFKDSIDNYQMNEVTLDYNAGFQLSLLIYYNLDMESKIL